MGDGRYKTRAQHYDGDDTRKWSGEARRQMTVLPPTDATNAKFAWPLYDVWVEKLGLAGGTAVDFGCGTAYYRSLFKELDYIGIDQNPEMIASSKIRWPESETVKFYQTPLTAILKNFPELKNTADAGLFVTVLQHNHHETAEEIMVDVCQILKPGAALFLFEATYIETYYPLETRQRGGFRDIDPECLDSMAYGAAVYTLKGWHAFFDRHGFDVLHYDNGCGHVAIKR
jgi:SAM-dependent methyltransferase